MENSYTVQELDRKIRELECSVSMLSDNGRELAKAERDYKVTLSTQALRLRADGMPVTLIDKVIYGMPEVADLRFKRDIAQSLYDANREAINSIKLQIRVLEGQIRQDWGVAKF